MYDCSSFSHCTITIKQEYRILCRVLYCVLYSFPTVFNVLFMNVHGSIAHNQALIDKTAHSLE